MIATSPYYSLAQLTTPPQTRDYLAVARTAMQAPSADRYQQPRSAAAVTQTPTHHWSKKKLLMMAVGAYLAYKFVLKGLLQKFTKGQQDMALYA